MGSDSCRAEQALGCIVGDPAEGPARLAEGRGIAALDIACADDEVGLARFELRQHLGQQRFVMLQIAIHHGHERRAGRENALDAGPGQAPARDTPEAAYPSVRGAQRLGGGGGAVRRIVVDDDDFPLCVGQGAGDPLHQLGDIAGLVEGRDDDGQFRRGTEIGSGLGLWRRYGRRDGGNGHANATQ